MNELYRHGEVDHAPIDTRVSIYHAGTSDQHPQQVPEVHEVEPKKTHESALKKITSIFKKTTHADFPHSEPYLGALNDIERRHEMIGEPIDSHVSAYHHGRSDEPPEATPSEAGSVKRTDALGRITSIFTTAKSTVTEFPVHGATYEGPMQELNRYGEVDHAPIDTHVSVYHAGTSDQQPQHVPEVHDVEPKKTHESALHKISSIFTRSTQADYPASEPYIGELADLERRHDLYGEPMHTSVSAYHSTGRSDEPPTTVELVHPIETVEKKTDTLTRITSMFATKHHEHEYPIQGVPYEGQIAETHRRNELDGQPLDTFVTAYHGGRSDEVRPTAEPVSHAEPDVIEEKKEAVSGLQKITSIFAARKHEDFPQTERYEGPLSELTRRVDVSGEPIDTHVSVYHPGTSDERLPESAPMEAEKKTDTLTRITSLFATKHHEHEFPVHGIPYEGPINELTRTSEVGGTPLDTHVTVYSTGRSDEHPQTTVSEPTPSEPEKREVSALGKLTSFFKKTAAHEDFPHSEPYSGAVMDLQRRHEVTVEPLDSRVSTYHSGRSDEMPTISTVEEVGLFSLQISLI